MINNTLATNTLRLAKVTHVHPEGQKLEVLFLDNGDYGRDVQVMSPYAGTDFGFTSGIPAPEEEGHEPNRRTDPNKRHIVAVIGTLQGRHICLGFLFPQVNHLAMKKGQDKNRLIERHTSDTYRTIDDSGNMEIVHPSGAHILISENDEPTDLEGRDYDGRWKAQKNTDKEVTITLRTASVFIQVKPDGVTIDAGSNPVDIQASEVNIDCDVNVTGSVAASGDVTAGAISLTGHIHAGVSSGGQATLPSSMPPPVGP